MAGHRREVVIVAGSPAEVKLVKSPEKADAAMRARNKLLGAEGRPDIAWLDALGTSGLVETVPQRLGVESPWPGAVVVTLPDGSTISR